MLVELLLLVTFVGAVGLLLTPDRYAPRAAFAWSLIPLVLSLWMYLGFEATGNGLVGGTLAYETTADWIALGDLIQLQWHVGLDGISMPLIVLTAVLTPAAILSAWTPIDERKGQFYSLMLFMEGSLIGVFAAMDFFLWFVFWEFVLVPMYFLIAVWGGPRRKYAAIKFFVYTNIASLVMFIGFASLVFALPVASFDLPVVAEAIADGRLMSLAGVPAGTIKDVAFLLMFAGFAVKVPVVPFHTWLPDAHVEAPTPVSVMLAGVLLKMGTYALLRFNFTMLPDVAVANAELIAIFAVVSVIYGAMLALAQTDLKRIVAYSSISSMGYVILGLVAYTVHGVGGATFQMLSHGLISGLMFMCVGVIYNTAHTRMVDDLSGLADRMPVTSAVFVAAAFGYMGLPLMSGFAAEFLVFVGSFPSETLPAAPVFTAIAMFGIVIVAGYLLFAMQRVLFGPFRADSEYDIIPAPTHDVAPLVALILLVVVLGSFPDLFYGMIQDASEPVVALIGGGS